MTLPPRASDRWPGAVLLAVAVPWGLASRSYDTALATDPVGPSAFPLLHAVLLGCWGLCLLLRPQPRPEWPARAAWLRNLCVLAGFASYPLVLGPLGFVPATSVGVAALALLFRGRPLPSLLFGVGLAACLYLVFAHGLGLTLPVGPLGF